MSLNDSSKISHTDWATLEAMNDEVIDYCDIPPLTDEFFENATLRVTAAKADNLIQLDADVIAWFREQSSEYETTINQCCGVILRVVAVNRWFNIFRGSKAWDCFWLASWYLWRSLEPLPQLV